MKEIVKHYGVNHQAVKLLEEMGELQCAVARLINGDGDFENFIEELADVRLVTLELIKYFGIEKSVRKVMAEKYRRTLEGINGEDK